MAKTWEQKYQGHPKPEIKALEKKFADIQAGESMVITSPQIVEDYMRSIPKGVEKTVADFRIWAAKKFGADKACPVTSGIFLKIVAEKQIEDMEVRGVSESKIAPFWRMIGPKSPLLKKLSFDLGIWKSYRLTEGLIV